MKHGLTGRKRPNWRGLIVTCTALMLVAAGFLLEVGAANPASAAQVDVTVTAKEKISLIMSNVNINFGSLDPGTIVTSSTPVQAVVKSNKRWDLTYKASGMDEAAGMPLGQLKWGTQSDGQDASSFNPTGTFISNQAKTSGYSVTHYYTIDVPWTADPGAYSATVTYSASFH